MYIDDALGDPKGLGFQKPEYYTTFKAPLTRTQIFPGNLLYCVYWIHSAAECLQYSTVHDKSLYLATGDICHERSTLQLENWAHLGVFSRHRRFIESAANVLWGERGNREKT